MKTIKTRSSQSMGYRRHRLIPIGVGTLLVLASLIAMPARPVHAAGDLLVAPTRLVFEGRERTAEVTLVNKGTETEVFRITMVNRRMLENGTFEEIDEPRDGEQFAGQMIRYAPRRVTLRPNAPQTIRVQLRKPSGIADGEYRSHLMFRAIPNLNNSQPEQAGAAGAGFQINLIPVYGVTIPVIVRHGSLKADLSVDAAEWVDPAFEDRQPEIAVRLSRSGEQSIYGTVKIMSTVGDETYALVRGVAIYTPNRQRIVRIPVDPALKNKVKGAPVRIAFFASKNDGGALLAEQQVTVR